MEMIHVRGISKDKEGSRWENMKNCLIFNELKMSGVGHDKSRLLTNYQNPREMAGKEFSDEKISIKFSNSVFCLNIYYWVWTGLCRIINVSCYLVHVHSSQKRCVQIIISCLGSQSLAILPWTVINNYLLCISISFESISLTWWRWQQYLDTSCKQMTITSNN